MAQVDDEGREPDHQHAGVSGNQAGGDELTGAGKHAERHRLSLPGRERTGGDQRAENHAERRGADQHRQGIARTGGEA